tara:strand:+ start:170 stop:433 length:264 start_codon:yes stop_codon:yes gene_type:complete
MTEKELYQNYKVKRVLYRALFFILLLIGLFIFVVSYNRYINGSPGIVFENPKMLLFMLAPFLPPFFFLFLSHRADDKLKKIVLNRSK